MSRSPGAGLSTVPRVAGAIVIVLLAGFATTGFLAVRTLEDELIDRLDRQLLDDARSTRSIIESLPGEDLHRLGREPRPSVSTALVIVDEHGAIAYAAPVERAGASIALPRAPDDEDAPNGVPFTTPAAQGDLEYRAVTVPTSTGLTLLVAAPLDDVHDTVATLAGRIAVIGGSAFAVLAVVTWLVVKNANRHIDALVDVAASIGAGDLTVRVDEAQTGTAGRLGAALNHMTAQLDAAFAARRASEDRLRRFSADASHELRTPLTHVRGYAELLRSGLAATREDQVRAATRIEAEAMRMTELVEDLLQLARLDQQRPLDVAPVDLAVLLVEAVSDARAADPDRTLTLDVEERVVVAGDDARLRQVVANLLANVRVHTPPNTDASVTLSRRDDGAVIRIHDDGPGMDAAAVAQAFEPFYRPESSRSRATGGSGLGLAIVQSIVHAHGGTITLDSVPGRGTMFTIDLPARARMLGTA